VSQVLRITCVGDVAPVRRAGDYIQKNMREARERFEEIFADCDIVFANFETPLASAIQVREEKKYVLNASPDVLDSLPEKIAFSLANNHIMDYREEGLRETLEHFTSKGIRCTGAGNNLEAAGKPIIITHAGRTVGFIACADPRYPSATNELPGIFPALPELLIPAIRKLKCQLDLVYVSVHMGMEYVPIPTPRMGLLARQCREAGADVVFFHHAHCLSGISRAGNNATLWGTGNFVFDESDRYPFKPWFESAAWRFIHHFPEVGLKTEIVPFRLNGSGFPEPFLGTQAEQIIRRIEKISRKIDAGGSMAMARLGAVLRSSYLKVVLSNYADMARRQGLRRTMAQVFSTLKTHFYFR
jgi:hypothetical protein